MLNAGMRPWAGAACHATPARARGVWFAAAASLGTAGTLTKSEGIWDIQTKYYERGSASGLHRLRKIIFFSLARTAGMSAQ
eukprot:scaffold188607_cov35-Prasinocladus_malaysianus.AAC.1